MSVLQCVNAGDRRQYTLIGLNSARCCFNPMRLAHKISDTVARLSSCEYSWGLGITWDSSKDFGYLLIYNTIHDMVTLRRGHIFRDNDPFCEGNPPVVGGSPRKGTVMVSVFYLL